MRDVCVIYIVSVCVFIYIYTHAHEGRRILLFFLTF